MVIYRRMKCPVNECKYHLKIIECSLLALEDHLFYDHGYYTKKECAEQLGLIRIGQSGLTSRELSRLLSKEGIIDE